MALTGALVVFVHAVAGFTNKSLRGLVAGLLGRDYTTNQMTYDLRRLRLHGLIERVPKTNTYVLTPEGLRVAVFYTKLHGRLLRPLAPPPTNRQPLSSYAAPWPPSIVSSPTTSTAPASGLPRETCREVQEPGPQEDLAARGSSAPTARSRGVLGSGRDEASPLVASRASIRDVLVGLHRTDGVEQLTSQHRQRQRPGDE